MKTRIVIDGNAFYEIDEECMMQKERSRQMRQQSGSIAKQAGKKPAQKKNKEN